MVIFSLSSCKSAETVITTEPIPDTSAEEAYTLGGGVPGGIMLGDTLTAAEAVPLPEEFPEEADSEGSNDQAIVATQAAEDYITTVETETDEIVSEEPAATAAATTAAATTAAATKAAETTEQTTTAATTTQPAKTAEVTAAASSGSYRKNSYKAVNHARVKAVWISYIELTNHLYMKSRSAFESEFGKMLDNCASYGINTVYVHVRSHGDAYYFSDLFPFTKNLSGTSGKRTDFDPLKSMVTAAHSRGMSLHAWINPLRLSSDLSSVPASYPVGKWYGGAEKGTYIVNVGGTWFLNPAYPDVRNLIGDNVREIVSNYDVDGVHIDDYFYPTTDASFDSPAFAASGYGSLSAFRINNINLMVKEMYSAAHECGSAWFGAAPQGNNINNHDVLYADTKAWCAGGYIDYFTPQIYYGFNNSGVPFKSNVDEWAGIVRGTNTKLYAGLALYKAGNEDKWAGTGKTEWQTSSDILKRQTEYAEQNGCSGIAIYSYSYIFDSAYKTNATLSEMNSLKPLLTK